MTVNNLAQQLSWLLSSKPHIPLHTGEPNPQCDISSGHTQSSSEEATSPGSRDVNADGWEQNDQLDSHLQIPGAIETVGGSVDHCANMARLRVTPNSAKKAQLVSAENMSDTNKFENSRKNETQRDKALIIPRTPDIHSARHFTHKTDHYGSDDVDTIDLTEDGGELSQGAGQMQIKSMAGRKRKSSEYEKDGRVVLSGGALKYIATERGGSAEFASIDDILEPPPPYSTVAQAAMTTQAERACSSSQASVPSSIKEFASGHDYDPIESHAVKKMQSNASPTRLLSISPKPGTRIKKITTGSENKGANSDMAPKTIPKHTGECSPAREDNSNGYAQESATPQSLTRPSTDDLQVQHFPIDKPFTEDLGKTSAKATSPVQSRYALVDKSACPSTLQIGYSSASELMLEKFNSMGETRLKRYTEELENKIEKHRDVIWACDGNAPPDVLMDIKPWKQKLKASKDLIHLSKELAAASARENNLKQKLYALVEDDQDDAGALSSVSAEIKIFKRRLSSLKDNMVQLVKSSGILEDSMIGIQDYGEASDSIVKSTQHQSFRDQPPFFQMPDSSAVSQTQVYPRPVSNREGQSGDSRALPTLSVSHQSYAALQRSPQHTSDAYMNHEQRSFRYGDTSLREGEVDEKENASGPSRDKDEDYLEDEEEGMFSTVMGTPPPQAGEDDDFYGSFDEDDEMLEVAAALDRSSASAQIPTKSDDHRPALTTSSGNAQRPGKIRNSSSPPKKHRQHLSMAGPDMQHPWSIDVRTALLDRFHLRGFRPNQLPAINATLSGKDAFVLMPTGGGKSLCYQLPSVIGSGQTQGVTVVISPLLSLMEDQVQHLQKLKIQAFVLNSECSAEERKQILTALREPRAEQFVQLLYVTPEMINKSQVVINAFRTLHTRNRLARIVLDEAHCVSQWGHDFRPDYKLLGDVRRQFLGVPVMALTATATENVKFDVMHNLGMTGCEVFTSSFNRPGLYYEVRQKGKAKEALDSIAEIITKNYRMQSGIVYCLSRKNCEDIALKLHRDHDIRAHHYHAGMEPEDRKLVQREWQEGKYKVIVATIAFGMGIDKANVRFVIHYSLPKSLEGYYQETGRAGRDGKRSGCYLFYGYQDTSVLRRFIDDSDGSSEQKERQHQMLRKMVQFCENRSDCRRAQVLAYFGETFRSEDCKGTCDNCKSDGTFQTQDFTDFALSAVRLVRELQNSNVTLLHCVDVFRGSKSKKIADAGHDRVEEYGAGRDVDRGDVERLFYRLLSDGVLREVNVVNKAGFASQYIFVGRKCHDFQDGRRRLKLQVRVSPNAKSKLSKPKKNAKTGVAAARQGCPLSTNVSSPTQAASKRRKVQEPVRQRKELSLKDRGWEYRPENDAAGHISGDEDNADDDDDAFGPVRIAGRRKPTDAQWQPSFGARITTDQKMEKLDENHRLVVEEFMERAKQLCRKILIEKSLRSVPFSDTVLREFSVHLPRSMEEMKQIDGVDDEKVELYGSRILPLINEARKFYEELQKDDEGEKPQDPNHQNVVNLVSEDEDESTENGDADSFMDEYQDPDLDSFAFEEDLDSTYDEEPQQTSHYFDQRPPDVQAFNSQFSMTKQRRGSDAGKRASKAVRKSSGSGGPSRKPYNRGYYARSSRGGAKQGRGGANVRRRKSSTTRGSSRGARSASGNGMSSAAGRVGRRGGGGIAMMPT